MMNTTTMMGQPVAMAPGQSQGPVGSVGPQQMMPSGVMSQGISTQARQTQNDEIITRCLMNTQRLRENLEILLNTTKQAAMIESEDALASSASSNPQGNPNQTSSTNTPSNPANINLKNIIDRKLAEMSQSIDQIGQSLEQFDFKPILPQPQHLTWYNDVSFEKQGTLIDEWSSTVRWVNKITELIPQTNTITYPYRRAFHRLGNPLNRARIDGPSYPIIEKIIAQSDSAALSILAAQQVAGQATPPREYSFNVQRLSDHLTILEMSLLRSGLVVYLYLRHCTVEHVLVKPLNEKKQFGSSFQSKTPSNYQALKIISGHIRSAAVYYASSISQPDQTLTKVIQYIKIGRAHV